MVIQYNLLIFILTSQELRKGADYYVKEKDIFDFFELSKRESYRSQGIQNTLNLCSLQILLEILMAIIL